jgi:hypothetical protein
MKELIKKKMCEPVKVFLGMLAICLLLCLAGGIVYKFTNDAIVAIVVSVVVTSAFWVCALALG